METQFVPVSDVNTLDHLFTRSHQTPVVLFKHSTTCPISRAAYQQMSELEGEVALVVVQTAREVSRDIATRTGIRHESPQAMVLRDGKVVWSASHWDVTAEAVKQAMSSHV
ncbi:MAG: bacillithiol system redox-active protein YtxJ [Pyrinomonadaceae bacterium]|nr:bacillithiol system redox-active protein YtxJ [Pyrinomonadaceae bacterium]